MNARGREDLSSQQAAVADARATLAAALFDLADSAKAAAKVSARPKGNPDLTAVHADAAVVRRAEEALDTALYDLHTAAGGHG